jgi:hypothetical protein
LLSQDTHTPCFARTRISEFNGVDAPVLVRALRVLVARGAAALIESDALDEVGVKFLRQ